jgi:hypothetical protein
MKVEYSHAVNEALENAPAAIQKAFFKQVRLLEQNLHHPSLRAKKFDEPRIAGRPGSIRTGDSTSRTLAIPTASSS